MKCTLVVEDDELVRWALEKELSARGLVVDQAATGAGALEKTCRTVYPLAFVGIHLPDRSGLDLLEPIREGSPETRVVILGCERRPDMRALAFARGAWQFVEKPFDLQDVIGLADRVFGTYTEKRRHERYLCRLPLRLSLVSHSTEEAALDIRNLGGTTIEIGEGGLRLQTAYPLRVGQRVITRLISTDAPCSTFVRPNTPAEVVWLQREERRSVAGLRYLADPIPGRIS